MPPKTYRALRRRSTTAGALRKSLYRQRVVPSARRYSRKRQPTISNRLRDDN